MNTFAPKSESDRTRPRSAMTGDAARNAAPTGGGNRLQETFDRSPRVVRQMKLARALSGRVNAPVQRQPVVQRVELPTDRTDQMIRFLVFRGGVNYDHAVAMSKTQLIEEFQLRTQGHEDEVLNYLLGEQGFDDYGKMGEQQKLEKFKELVPGDTGTGLAEDKILTKYAKDVAEIDPSEWTLADPDKKVRILVEYVNDALTKTGTPHVKFDFQKFAPDTNAIFDHETWKISFNELTFDPKHPAYSELSLGKVMNTAYHEARHAQQWYRVATLLAGDGLNAQAIGQKTGIKVESVLNFAEAHPLKRTAGDVQDVKEAIAWEDSFIGPFAQEKTKIRTDLFNTEKEIGDQASRREVAKAGMLTAKHDKQNLDSKLEDMLSHSQAYDRAKRNLTLWQSINQEDIGWAAKYEKFEKTFEKGPSEVFDQDLEAELLGGETTNETTNQLPELTENDWLEGEGFLKKEMALSARKVQAYQKEFRINPIKQQKEKHLSDYQSNKLVFEESNNRIRELQKPYEFLFQKYKDFVEEHDAFDIGDHAQQRYGELIQKKAAPGNVVQRVDLSQEGNRQPLLDLIRQSEDNSLFGSGTAERVRLYLESLGETELEKVGRAVDAVERKVDQTDPLEDEDTRDEATAQKIQLSKIRLLVRMAAGKVTAAALNQESLEIGENELVMFDIEELAESVTDDETSAQDFEIETSALLDSIGIQSLNEELTENFSDFPNANPQPIIDLNREVLLRSNQYTRLRTLIPKIKQVEQAILTSGSTQARENLKPFKAWLLAEFFTGDSSFRKLEAISNATAQEFLNEKLHFLDQNLVFLSNSERTPDQIRGAFKQDVQARQTTGHQKAVEQQELDRTRLREFIEDGAINAPEGSPFRNACEWLLSGRSKLYALTKTHDSETRALKANAPGRDAWFPKSETGLGHVLSDQTDYASENNDNVMFSSKNSLGGSTPDGSVVINGASQMSDEELRRTIVHEVQHSSDMHDQTPLSRFQSEVNAYLLGHEQHPEAFLAGKGADETVEGEGGTWNARVKAIFEHMRSSGGYSYLGEAWGLNENDFKEKVRAIQGPSTPNPINSVRIANFNQALVTGINLTQAYQALDPYDLAALKNNPATLELLERHLEDGQLELYKSYFQ